MPCAAAGRARGAAAPGVFLGRPAAQAPGAQEANEWGLRLAWALETGIPVERLPLAR
jgi:hypothetical protein